jgi:hypothetical protein
MMIMMMMVSSLGVWMRQSRYSSHDYDGYDDGDGHDDDDDDDDDDDSFHTLYYILTNDLTNANKRNA